MASLPVAQPVAQPAMHNINGKQQQQTHENGGISAFDSRKKRLDEFMSISCETTKEGEQVHSESVNVWATKVLEMFQSTEDNFFSSENFEEVESAFRSWELEQLSRDKTNEFDMIESFVLEEQNLGRTRRKKARILAATEEVDMAKDVAELKGYRIKTAQQGSQRDLQMKVADVERSHLNRKMILAKASQLATSDCRQQFARVREFFEELHLARKNTLRQQFERSLKIQALSHKMLNVDSRVVALEQNAASRIYRQKESDMNEIHMAQNLEEAVYLETIISLLDGVQHAKETATNDVFKLQVENLRLVQEANLGRDNELKKLQADATLEIAKLVGHYVEEEMQNNEDDEQKGENISYFERRKDFRGTTSTVQTSISDLYDTILWSVATSSLGISTSGSSLFSSDFDSLEDEEEEKENPASGGAEHDRMDHEDYPEANRFDTKLGSGNDVETSSVQSGSTANSTVGSDTNPGISVIGLMHIKKAKKELREKEKAIVIGHKRQVKEARQKYRAKLKELKKKHETIIETLLNECVMERHRLRDAISERMATLEAGQDNATKSLQEGIDKDVKLMQNAWEEHKRLEDERKSSFAKAQALISAQVFHEVRNALSSVVAMSEMTSSLQKDPTISNETLVSAVNEMLDQNKEVVHYSLNMLNNILDVSKIKAGSFTTTKNQFDLQDLVARATRMQLVKAQTRGVKMSFTPIPRPQIAYSDEDIVVRIVTNFISNSVKFTVAGVVQPFICPVESLISAGQQAEGPGIRSDDPQMRMVAVGVADTGPGLSHEILDLAKAGLFNSDSKGVNSGAKNSGFGLHLAHQLAGTLGTKVFLMDMEQFRGQCNEDMLKVLTERDNPKMKMTEKSLSNKAKRRGSLGRAPGRGAVLFITVPVLKDSRRNSLKHITENVDSSSTNSVDMVKYVFSPRPAPDSANGCFRILVADDVDMLRKGLVGVMINIFKKYPDCPVDICTACSAEDALRAVKSQPFDLFICDNQFADPGDLSLSCHMENHSDRPHVSHQGNSNSRKSITAHFENERFTIEEGDGLISGLEAVSQLINGENDKFYPNPVLMLLSGHKIDLPPSRGIIVVQKPLKSDEFVPVLEKHACYLIESGQCEYLKNSGEDGDDKKNSSSIVVNRHGTQLFTRKKEG